MPWTQQQLAGMIDHTILRPAHTDEDVRRTCREARQWGFHTVCTAPCDLPILVEELADSPVAVGVAIDIPMGMATAAQKARAASEAVTLGAEEVDFVAPLVAIKSGRWADVADELRGLRDASGEAVLKCIFETCYLDDDEKRRLCELSVEAGLDFVKTATGFGPGGATVEDIRLMATCVGDRARVKAAGGIRRFADLAALAEAGAVRFGTSSGVAIVQDFLGVPIDTPAGDGDE